MPSPARGIFRSDIRATPRVREKLSERILLLPNVGSVIGVQLGLHPPWDPVKHHRLPAREQAQSALRDTGAYAPGYLTAPTSVLQQCDPNRSGATRSTRSRGASSGDAGRDGREQRHGRDPSASAISARRSGSSASAQRLRRGKAEPCFDDVSILRQMTQGKPEMPGEIDHHHVLRQDLAHDLAHAMQPRPIEETPHEMSGQTSALQVVLHDYSKLSHWRIVFADEARHRDGLAGFFSYRDEGHVAVIAEPGELIELRRREFAHGREETQPDVLRREAVEEGVVLRDVRRADRPNEQAFASSLPMLFHRAVRL